MSIIKRPDGTYSFKRRIEKRKKGVFVAVAGPDQEFNTIQTTVKGFFNWANIELTETVLYQNDSNELGGVKNNQELMNRAFEIGSRMAKILLNSSGQ
jgi:hypothetical protein